MIVIVVVIVLVFAGESGKTPKNPTPTSSGVHSTGGAHPPAADVSITSCEVDSAISFAQAKLEIVNHSSKPSDYIIGVEFVDAKGTRVAEGTAIQNHVAPGEKVEDTAGGSTQASGRVTCKVTSVDRFSSVG